MKLLLANEADCRFFKFWFHDRIYDGISYQNELFYRFHSFSSKRREYAYEVGARLLQRGICVIICCSSERYLLGIKLCSGEPIAEVEKQQVLSDIQDLDSMIIFA